MKLDVKIQLLKFCAQLVNAIFLVLDLNVAGCAVWILFSRGNLLAVLPSEELQTVGAGLLLIGGVVMVVGVIGCVGADRENRFLLLMYLVFLIVLLLGQLFVTLLLLISKEKIGGSLDATVEQMVREYGGKRNSQADRLMDSVQKSGACCGLAGSADWLENSYIQRLNLSGPDVLPCSCFSSYRPAVNSSWCSELLHYTPPLYGRGNSSYEQGCKEKLSDWLQENALTIVGMGVGLVLIQALQCVLVVSLFRAAGQTAALKRADRLADGDHAHLDQAPEGDLDYGEQNYGYEGPDDAYTDPARPACRHDNQNHS
ncbi:CD82 antigen [Pempheris klunzingeri]|uniref:CD82 antigen n=1 Tax=Pempheris klunzingeri TaxID=3127111 RepID=UPI00398156CF